MMHAPLRPQNDPQRRSGGRGAAAHPADRALTDLLARTPESFRAPLQASAYAAAREASVRFERESPRCACGGTCPKCQSTALDELDDRRTGKRESLRRPEAETDAMDGATGTAQPGRGGAVGQAATAGIEEDPVVEYANGETSCDRDTGTMSTVIHNTKCTRPCTEEHEADHRAYRGTCCSSYAAARQAAIAAGDTARRNALTSRYNAWISATSDFSECRAYRVSVACGERMETDLGCSTPTDENRSCCADVRSYLTSVRASRDSRCPGTDQTCPDFSA